MTSHSSSFSCRFSSVSFPGFERYIDMNWPAVRGKLEGFAWRNQGWLLTPAGKHPHGSGILLPPRKVIVGDVFETKVGEEQVAADEEEEVERLEDHCGLLKYLILDTTAVPSSLRRGL
jgi:hypothetical protein